MTTCDPELYKKLFPRSLTEEQILKQRIPIPNEKRLKEKAKASDIEFLENCLQYLKITKIYTQDSKKLLKTKLIQLYYKYAAISGNEFIFEYFRKNGYSKYMPDNISSFIFQKKNNY